MEFVFLNVHVARFEADLTPHGHELMAGLVLKALHVADTTRTLEIYL